MIFAKRTVINACQGGYGGGSCLDCAFLKKLSPRWFQGREAKHGPCRAPGTPPELLPGHSEGKGQETVRDAVGSSGVCDAGGVQTTGKGQTDVQQEQMGQPPIQPGLLLTMAGARGAVGNPLHKALTDAPPDPTCSLWTDRGEGHVRRGDSRAPCLSFPLSLSSSLPPPLSCFYVAEKEMFPT